MDIYKHEKVSKYDIPISHLDFEYINKCKDIKELEKIIRILRSGKEGQYPELQQCAEDQLTELHPQSKVLRKEQPVYSLRDIERNEADKIIEDLDSWGSEMKRAEETGKTSVRPGRDPTEDLPPVRGTGTVIPTQQNSGGNVQKAAHKKSATPRSYSDWDKVDVDAELAKIDEDEDKTKKKGNSVLRKPKKPEVVETLCATDMTPQERSRLCEREKDKGNEAFRAGDWQEALVYYNRSLSLMPSTAVYNNRAQTNIKLQEWEKAVADCNTVLNVDGKNIKGYLRRAMAYQGKKQYKNAKADLEALLEIDPGNRRAKQVLTEVQNSLKEQKVKGHRLIIDEVSSDEDSSEEIDTNEKLPRTTAVDLSDSKTASMPKGLDSEVVETPDGSREQRKTSGNKPKGTTSRNNKGKPHPDETKSDIVENDTTGAAPSGKDTNEETLKGKDAEIVPTPLPRNVARLKDEGNELFRCGQYAEAIDKYTASIELLSHDEKCHITDVSVLYTNRAASRHKTGDCVGCVEDCTHALSLTPNAPKPLLRRAIAYEVMERYKHAFLDFRQVLALEASWEVAQQGATRCGQMLQEMYGRSWRDLLPVATTPQQQQQTQQQPQQQQQTQQQPQQQHKNIHQKKQPQHQNKQQQKQQQQQLKQPEQQQPTQQQQKQQQQQSTLSTEELFAKHKEEGNTHVQKGHFAEAIDCYSRCVSLCSDRAVSYTNRALCYLRTNHAEKALSDCSMALNLEPHNVKALFRRAQALKMLKRYPESLSDLDQLLKMDPHNKPALKERSLVETYRHEQEVKSREPRRQKLKIEEVDSSSDEEDDDKSVSSSKEKHIARLETDKNGRTVSHEAESVAKTTTCTKENSVSSAVNYSKDKSMPDSNSDRESICVSNSKGKSLGRNKEESDIGNKEKCDVDSKEKPVRNTKEKSVVSTKEISGSANNEKSVSKTKEESGSASNEKSVSNTKEKSGSASSEKSVGNSRKEKKNAEKSEVKKTSSSGLDNQNSVNIAGSYEIKRGRGGCITQTAGDLALSGSGDCRLVSGSGQLTPYEFLHAWTSLKKSDSDDGYLSLLLQIEPVDLPKVISNKLDGGMLQKIIACAKQLVEKGDGLQAYSYLQHLASVPRFDIVTMFMTRHDKQEIQQICDHLVTTLGGENSQTGLNNLQAAYGV